MGLADCDHGFVAADDTADDGVVRESHVLQRNLCDLGVRRYDIFENLCVGAAHIFDEADLVAEGEFEDSSCSDKLLVDDGVHAHAFCESDIFDILHLCNCPCYAKALGCHACEDVCLGAVGYGYEGVVVSD